MSVFSDEDLKRLKVALDTGDYYRTNPRPEELKALLARLEAAEGVILLCDSIKGGLNHKHPAYRIWKISKGE